MKTFTHLWYLDEFLLEWEMFQTKAVEENQNTHFPYNNFFYPKIVPFIRESGNIFYSRQATNKNTAHVLCVMAT